MAVRVPQRGTHMRHLPDRRIRLEAIRQAATSLRIIEDHARSSQQMTMPALA